MRALRISVLAFVVCGVAAAGVMAAIIPNESAANVVIKACVAGALAALFVHARVSGSARADDNVTLGEPALALLAGIAPLVVVAAGAMLVLLGLVGFEPLWRSPAVSLETAARNGDIAEVFRLVRAGADPNAALEAGVESRQVEVLDVLVAAGATADEARRQRLACLAVAAIAPEVSEYLRNTLPPASPPACAR